MTREQLKQLETDLWAAADKLRANSDLSEYAVPVFELIFLKFADNNYRRHEVEIVSVENLDIQFPPGMAEELTCTSQA